MRWCRWGADAKKSENMKAIAATLMTFASLVAFSSGAAQSLPSSSCVTVGTDVEAGYNEAIDLTVRATSGYNALRTKWGLAHADSADVQLVRDDALCKRAIKTTMSKEYRKGARIVLFRVHDIYVVTYPGEGDHSAVLDRHFRLLDTFIVPS